MDAKTKTVLIVEDNELNMKLFHDLLDAHGYNILQTKDGMEALDIAREHHPDLILMDIQLPEVSGLEVTKWLKEDDSLKAIPVVAVTAFAMKGDEEVIRQGNHYILRLPLPHVEMDKVLMTKKGDEMIIEIGNFKRDITLPAVLANQEATVAKFVNKALEIHFTVPEEEEQKSA